MPYRTLYAAMKADSYSLSKLNDRPIFKYADDITFLVSEALM